jgi:hypothetical protein
MTKKKIAVILALAALTLFLPVWGGGGKAAAENINILPYYAAGNVGDSWIYTYITPPGTPDFTVTLTQETSGPFVGKYRLGDYVLPGGSTEWQIFDLDASGINVYETASTGVFTPPGKIPAVLPLNEMFVNPLPIENNYWYLMKVSSLTVPAGTFNDVLLQIALDDRYDPNGANSFFGLDTNTVPHAVTHVEWMAAGFGVIQNVDIDAESGNLVYEYQLKATSVVPLPAPLVMLGSGLLGMLAFRKRFAR